MQARHRSLQTALTAVLATSLIACASLADESSQAPALATISGTLSLAEGASVQDGSLRLALLWSTDDENSSLGREHANCELAYARNYRRSEQQIEIEPRFPSQFELRITEPPPPDALIPSIEGGPRDYGESKLVAYVDGNGNGQLDSRVDGAPSPDQVLASSMDESSPTLWVPGVYATGFHYHEQPSPEGAPAGYSQLQYVVEQDYSGTAHFEPIETPIELVLDPSPKLQQMLCEWLCFDRDDPFECPASMADLPVAPEGIPSITQENIIGEGWAWREGDAQHLLGTQCTGQGQVLNWSHERCEGCSCRLDHCLYRQADVPAADWPCTAP